MQRSLLLAGCLVLCVNLFSQKIRFDQSFGLGANIADISGVNNFFDTTGKPVLSEYTVRVKKFGIVYTPRIDLLGTKDVSLSIATPFMLGFSTTNKYRSVDVNGTKKDTIEGLRGTSLAFELPVFADINIGLRSAADESKRVFGVYAGVGYIYSYTTVKTTAGKVDYDNWEPAIRAGIRMGASWEKRWSLLLVVHGKFEHGSQKTYGLQILKEL
jgi:hypothetical protein